MIVDHLDANSEYDFSNAEKFSFKIECDSPILSWNGVINFNIIILLVMAERILTGRSVNIWN